MFPSGKIISDLKNNPLYKEAYNAFVKGDNKKGKELLNKLQNSDAMKDVHKFYDENDSEVKQNLQKKGIIMIDKQEPIPEGYNRNSYSPKTCITTQQQDLPEWKNSISLIKYDGEVVYEDHYAMRFTTMNMLYDIKTKNPKDFIGEITINDSIDYAIAKFKKNSLYLIISKLNLTINNNHSVLDTLPHFFDVDSLESINIQTDRQYNNIERNTIKKLFLRTKWCRLNINNQFTFER
jgi:hypothetical protein